MKSLACDQVRELLSDLLAVEIDSTDAESVEAHLAWCQPCCREAECLFQQDRLLAQLAGEADLPKLRARIRKVLAHPERQSGSTAPAPTSPPQASPAARAWSRRRTLLATAATLLLATGILWWGMSWRTPQLAQFERVQGEVHVIGSDGKVLARSGQPLRAGQEVQVGEDSLAVVAYADSARLELGAETKVLWLTDATGDAGGGKRVFLAEGVLTVDVPDRLDGSPMVLATPHAEVLAQGNRVNLIQGGDSTRVEPERGTAKVVRKNDGQAVEVKPGSRAVVGADGRKLIAQELPPRRTISRATLAGHPAGVVSLTFADDGQFLASGGNTGSVIVWNMTTGVIHRTWSDQAALVRCLAFAPDGQTLAMAGDDRVIRFGDLASGESRVAPKGLPSVAFALRFAPHGKTLTTCGYDRRLKTWLVATAQLKSTIRLEPYQSEYDFPACMSFSIDGQLLAWGLKDNTARLWETATAKERHVLRGHEAAVTAVGFSPDGKAFCTGSRDRTAKLWNVASGKLLATLAGHRHTVQTVAFHPTGNLLATGSADGAVKLWDLRTLGELAVLQGHSKAVQAVAFAPDGRTLATAGMEGVVQLWNIAEME